MCLSRKTEPGEFAWLAKYSFHSDVKLLQFKSLLAPIGKITLQDEHDSLAYAWFQSDTENEVPDRYMRGLEV
jgi:hypothetical protein